MSFQVATCRVYIACLAAYNNGILHGEWVDVTYDVDDLHEGIRRVLASSPIPDAEEWAIHDYDGFMGIKLGENPDLEKLVQHAELLEEHGRAWAVWIGDVTCDADEIDVDTFRDAYQGEWDSQEDFVEDLFTQCTTIPEHLQYYIDWEKMARDWFINDYTSEYVDGKHYVFNRNW